MHQLAAFLLAARVFSELKEEPPKIAFAPPPNETREEEQTSASAETAAPRCQMCELTANRLIIK